MTTEAVKPLTARKTKSWKHILSFTASQAVIYNLLLIFGTAILLAFFMDRCFLPETLWHPNEISAPIHP